MRRHHRSGRSPRRDSGIAFRIAQISGHQVDRSVAQVEADFALISEFSGQGVHQYDRHSRGRSAHGTGLDLLSRHIAHLQCGLGLSEAVTNGQSPGLLDLGDHIRIERLTGAEDFAQTGWSLAEIGLNQHAPHRRWRAERVHLRPAQLLQQRRGVESAVVVDEYGRLGQPRREEAAPGMLGPAGCADGQVDIAGAHADPVHGGQMADRIADLRVLHHFRPAGGAGGEVHQQRIVHRGDGGERTARLHGFGI